MDVVYLKRQLALNRDRVAALARGVSEEQARWKPDEESWSILEVVAHLADEEEFDFPLRMKIVLEDEEKNWPEIDPTGWVTEREYNQGDLYESLNRYFNLRNEWLVWLDSLEKPDWEGSYEAPFGMITAGELFASWVTHDLLHLRQLVELHRRYMEEQTKPYKMDYAGEW
jgi:hypothetical protein